MKNSVTDVITFATEPVTTHLERVTDPIGLQVSEAANHVTLKWGTDSTIIAAVIGVFAFVLAQLINGWLVRKRDANLHLEEKKRVALFARAELINVKRHHEANLMKIHSILESDSFGEPIDYLKMRLGENGLIALDLSRIYILPDGVAQDLLRFSLFCRNNESEISLTEKALTSHGGVNSKQIAIIRLATRFFDTIDKAEKIAENLYSFSKSHKLHICPGINWSTDLWKYFDSNEKSKHVDEIKEKLRKLANEQKQKNQ